MLESTQYVNNISNSKMKRQVQYTINRQQQKTINKQYSDGFYDVIQKLKVPLRSKFFYQIDFIHSNFLQFQYYQFLNHVQHVINYSIYWWRMFHKFKFIIVFLDKIQSIYSSLHYTQLINLLFSMKSKIKQTEAKLPNTSITSTVNESIVKSVGGVTAKKQMQKNSILKSKKLFQSNFIGFGRILTQNPEQFTQSTSLWRQSSATWRNSSYKFSFSRDTRFKQQKCSHLDIQQLQFPSTMNKKSCSMGKGQKIPISLILLRNAKVTPAPDRYNIDKYLQTSRDSQKGKTFGVNWNSYKKVHINHRKDPYSSHFTQGFPPAIYDIREKIGKDKKKASIYARLKMFNDYQADLKKMYPGPGQHIINDNLTKNNKGLNERNFGFGQRIDLSKPLNQNPSPDAYDIKGFSDRYKNL